MSEQAGPDFPREEYQARVKRAQELMVRHGLDALMITGDLSASMNYRYFSGHLPRDYQANYSRPHVMLLTKEGEAALLVYVLNELDAKHSSWVTNITSYTQPFTYRRVQELIEDMGLQRARIGCELGLDQRLMMPVQEFKRLEESLPKAQFVDASELLWEMRMIKSRREAECIRRADEMNGRALERTFEELREGMSEIDAAKLLVKHMIEEGSWRPPHSQMIVNSGPDWRVSFMPAKEKVLRKGDLLFIDSGCTFKGYWGEFSRMAVVGEPDERQKRNHRAITRIVQRIIREVVKPGVKMSDAIRFLVKMYKEEGFGYDVYKSYLEYPFMHLSHGIGLHSSEPPFVRIDNDMPFRAGMVLSVEAYLRDVELYGTEEDIYITEDGCEVLSERYMDTRIYSLRS